MKKFLSACLVMCGLAAMADTVVTVEAVEEIAIGGGGESAMTMALGMPTLWWSAPVRGGAGTADGGGFLQENDRRR